MDRNSPHPMVDPLLALALATILILTFNFIKGHPLGISGRLSRLLRRGMKTEQDTIYLCGWAMVFLWGAYTNAALQLSGIFRSRVSKVWFTCLVGMLVLGWLWNVGLTVKLLSGKLKLGDGILSSALPTDFKLLSRDPEIRNRRELL
ncbi:uncharacterized protein CLUP02_14266 [Colletotrichum lupini]|uniref:Uncharacterized protein n=1 Tax=Colletotrichum lupini TaxID=145971 RepID=A0A9Q8T3X3_9PEZI|nr:uncharacterized protein CLUP02_14266 [Colletotrichum lupini]KAK1702194.1 hypothetical protein BDP67DRAFT_279572 [Colletotrichum lupini]UQC88741.1 hypothetical protein CLUP02_14266 [Colletotrichum lupini]